MAKWQVCLVFATLLCGQVGSFLIGDFGGSFNFGDIGNIGDLGNLGDLSTFDPSSFTQSAINNLKNLPSNLQSALKNAGSLLKLSLPDLSKIPTDIFGSLSSSALGQFNASTVKALSKKFTSASTSVITHFFSNIPKSSFLSSLSSLQKLTFQPSQLKGFAKAYKKAIGDVSQWTKNAFKDFGKLVGGLSSFDLGKISKDVFDDVLGDLPVGDFSWDQAQGIFKSAKSAWGDASSWTKDQLKKLKSSAVNLPLPNVARLSADAVSSVADDWNDLIGWSHAQKAIVTNKLKTSWGRVSSWDKGSIKKISNLLDGLSVQDFSQLDFSKLISSSLRDVVGNSWLSDKQLDVVASNLKSNWGSVRQWTAKQIGEAGRSLKALLPSELFALNFSAVKDRFDDFAADCGFSFPQANVLLDRLVNVSVPSGKKLSSWSHQNLNGVGCLARGFVCGEFRQLQTGVVRYAKDIISNSDWSRPQLKLLIEKFGVVQNLLDLEGLAPGIARKQILSLNWDALSIANLSSAVLQKFDNAQLIAIAQKAVQFMGSSADSDDFWRADKIKSYGRMLRGLSRETITNIPQESFSDFVDALSGVADATQGQIETAIEGFKMYSNISKSSDLSRFSAIDIAEMGPLVISLKVDELKALSPEACQEALVQITLAGDNLYRWASKTKLVSVAKWAVDCLKAVEPILPSLTADHVALLGRLVEFLDQDASALISSDAVTNSLSLWGSFIGADQQGVEKYASLVKKYLSFNSLTVQDVIQLGNVIRGLSLSDLESIPDEAIAGAVSEIGEISSLDGERIRTLTAKVKKIWGNDVGNWTGIRLKSLGRLLAGLTSLDIESISSDAFEGVVDLLGKSDLTNEQLQAGITLAKKAWGDLKAVSAKNLRRLRNLLTSLSPNDLGDLVSKVFSCDDTLSDLGQVKGWTSDQLAKVVEKAKAQFGSVDSFFSENLGAFAEGLANSDFQSLPYEAIKQALEVLGKVNMDVGKKDAVIRRLVNQASVFNWDRSLINAAGDLLEALVQDDVQLLPTENLDAIDADTVPRLGNFFAKMAPYQLAGLAPEQTRALSAAQVSGLSAEQCTALEESDSEYHCDSASPTSAGVVNLPATVFALFSVAAMLLFN